MSVVYGWSLETSGATGKGQGEGGGSEPPPKVREGERAAPSLQNILSDSDFSGNLLT